MDVKKLEFNKDLNRFVRVEDGKVYACVEDIIQFYLPERDTFEEILKKQVEYHVKNHPEKSYESVYKRSVYIHKQLIPGVYNGATFDYEKRPLFYNADEIKSKKNWKGVEVVVQNDEYEIADVINRLQHSTNDSVMGCKIGFALRNTLKFFYKEREYKEFLKPLPFSTFTNYSLKLSILAHLTHFHYNISYPSWLYVMIREKVPLKKDPSRFNPAYKKSIYLPFLKNTAYEMLLQYHENKISHANENT